MSNRSLGAVFSMPCIRSRKSSGRARVFHLSAASSAIFSHEMIRGCGWCILQVVGLSKAQKPVQVQICKPFFWGRPANTQSVLETFMKVSESVLVYRCPGHLDIRGSVEVLEAT